MFPSTKQSRGSVPSPNPGSNKNSEPFQPGPSIKGPNSTGGPGLDEYVKGTAKSPVK